MEETKVAMKVLIVDDSSTGRRLLQKVLSGAQAGYEIFQAESGPAALESVALQLPDIILLDIMMPGMDGFEVCRILKSDAKTATIPVLFITALEMVQDMVRGFQVGAVDYITKPFRAEEVKARVAAHLQIRRVEKALVKAKKDWEDSFNSINDAITIHDTDFNVLHANKAATTTLGLSIDEILRNKCFVSYHGKECPPEGCSSCKVLKTGVSTVTEFFESHLNKFIEITATPRFDDDHNIIGLVHVVRDITENRRLTEALKKSHENLEAQVKERTAELTSSFQKLQAVSEDLKKANKVKSEFLANMSHELRSPLNSVIGFSEVLYDERFGPLNKRQKKYAENINVSGRHLLSLINEVLDLSKVEAGKAELVSTSFSIRGCMKEALLQMERQAFSKKIELAMEVPEDFDTIHGDLRRINQILYNLLSNAIKFTPAGGKAGIRARSIGAGIEVTVWDTGIGIAPENLEKVFGAFERLENVYVQETEGTGLGLTISRKMIELHGGKMWIESEGAGRGAAVKFTIPGCVK